MRGNQIRSYHAHTVMVSVFVLRDLYKFTQLSCENWNSAKKNGTSGLIRGCGTKLIVFPVKRTFARRVTIHGMCRGHLDMFFIGRKPDLLNLHISLQHRKIYKFQNTIFLFEKFDVPTYLLTLSCDQSKNSTIYTKMIIRERVILQ